MNAILVKLTGLGVREQFPAWMVGLGHGGTHWVIGVFYLLSPAIQRDLGLSYTQIGTLFAVFHAASFIANFGSGAATDMVGNKVTLQVVSLVLGAMALGAMGLAGGYWTLAAMMAIVGATNNLWHPPAISYLAGIYRKTRGYALSLHALGASAGDSLAPAVTGVLLTAYGWRVTAGVNAAPVILLAVLLLAVLKANGGGEGKPRMTLKSYVGGFGLMLKDRMVAILCVMSGFRTMTMMGLYTFLPLYLVNEIGLSLVETGVAMTAFQLGGLIITPIAGVWSDRAGRRPVVMAGLAGTTVILAGLTFLDNQFVLVAGITLMGVALFATRPVMHSWLMDMTPGEMGGSATSLMFGTQSLFNIFITFGGGLIADAHGLTAVFHGLAGAILAANVLVLFMPGEERAVGS